MSGLSTGMGDTFGGALGYATMSGIMSMGGMERGKEGEAFLTGFGMSMTVYGINYLAGGGVGGGGDGVTEATQKQIDSLNINKADVGPPVQGGYTVRSAGKYGTDRTTHTHAGLDMRPIVRGKPVNALPTERNAKVTHTGYHSDYGNYVITKNPSGVYGMYAHLNSINVKAGNTVTWGQSLGIIGNTGRSTGVHLHFQVGFGLQRIRGGNYRVIQVFDPAIYLRR